MITNKLQLCPQHHAAEKASSRTPNQYITNHQGMHGLAQESKFYIMTNDGMENLYKILVWMPCVVYSLTRTFVFFILACCHVDAVFIQAKMNLKLMCYLPL